MADLHAQIVRSAYLYARHNGCTDLEAAKFADWFSGSGFGLPSLPPEFLGWLDRSLSDA